VWCGLGVLAHYTVKIAARIENNNQRPDRPARIEARSPMTTGPPRRGPPADRSVA